MREGSTSMMIKEDDPAKGAYKWSRGSPISAYEWMSWLVVAALSRRVGIDESVRLMDEEVKKGRVII